MAQKEQSFANHTRLDPIFHRFLIPVAALMVIATIVQLIRFPDWWGVVRIVAAVWALLLTSCAARPAATPPLAAPVALASPLPAPVPAAPPHFRLRACAEAPVHLEGAPGAAQSGGCVATYRQRLTDPNSLVLLP